MLLAEIKDFNTLIDHESFFDQPIKKKTQAYEKLVEISRNTDYATGNLLDYLYHHKHYNLIGIDLSRQTDMSIHQQIKLQEKLKMMMV